MIQFFLMKIPCFPRFLPEYRSCFGITAYQVCFSMLTYHVRYKFQSRWPGRWIMRSVKKPLFSGAESISLRVPSSAGRWGSGTPAFSRPDCAGEPYVCVFTYPAGTEIISAGNMFRNSADTVLPFFFQKQCRFSDFFFGKARKPDVKTPVSGSVQEVYVGCIKE